MTNRACRLGAGILSAVAFSAVCLQPAPQPALSAEWKKWLNEDVVYIVTPKEREIFLSLSSDRERLAFRDAFWNQRDPTPGTPANEFRDEHYRRLRHANVTFGRGTVKLGWETDRGRIYILLGEPLDIQRYFEASVNLLPTELWQYEGDPAMGFPPSFYLIFYQDPAGGDYKLYSPSFDGPQKLIFQSSVELGNRAEAYERIREVSPELAGASLSLIPGTEGDPSSASSLSSDFLLAEVFALPQKKFKSEWADVFARNKEIVTTDYSASYVESESVLFLHQDGGRHYLHILVEPKRLSFQSYEDKAFVAFKLNAKISDKQGRTIHQEEKTISLEMPRADFLQIERTPAAVGDFMPVVEGARKIDLLLQNKNTKEFSSLEAAIDFPLSSGPGLSPILCLSDERQTSEGDSSQAFVLGNHFLRANPRRIYSQTDEAILYWEIYNSSPELEGGRWDLTLTREDREVFSESGSAQGQPFVINRIPLRNLSPGYYECAVSLKNSRGEEISRQRVQFTLSPLAAVPKPWSFSKIYPPLDHSYFSVIRAYQYLGLGENDRVIAEVQGYYDALNPNKEIAKLLAWAYSAKGDQVKTQEILKPFADTQDLTILEILGKSHFALKDYAGAAGFFRKALTVGGEIIELINYLGFSLYGGGDSREALKYFERSMALNPQQPGIRVVIDRIKKSGQK